MTDNVYLNADKTKVVSEFTVGKKWQVPRRVAFEMGLLDSPTKPVQERRAPEPVAPRPPQKRRKPKSE